MSRGGIQHGRWWHRICANRIEAGRRNRCEIGGQPACIRELCPCLIGRKRAIRDALYQKATAANLEELAVDTRGS
jgi:hypothetical protein